MRYENTLRRTTDMELKHKLQAQERQESAFRAPRQRVEDYEELDEYRGRKRKEFEDRIRRTRGNMCVEFLAHF